VYWQAFLGVVLVVLVLALPTGIVGTFRLLVFRGRRRLYRSEQPRAAA
jgi:hypothetical protein